MPRELSPEGLELLELYPPFLRSVPEVAAVVDATALELADIEEAAAAIRDDAFPALTNSPALWEAMLSIAADPSAPVAIRRGHLLAALLRVLSTGSGVEWEANMSALFGGSWTYREYVPGGPPPNTAGPYIVDVFVPYDPDTPQAVIGEQLALSITPANTVLNVSYEDGFIVGISTMGDVL